MKTDYSDAEFESRERRRIREMERQEKRRTARKAKRQAISDTVFGLSTILRLFAPAK